jgi:hypothetical protein
MKKKGIFFVFLVCLIFPVSFAAAAGNQTVESKAYSCLESKVEGKCSSLSTEEKIFSLLTIERCKTELMSDSSNNECWPKGGCKIKTTAQAILALKHVNADTVKAENWLLSQTMTSSDIDWFLQVEAENETSCTATYSEGTYTFSLDEDKTLSGSAGSCLRLYNEYWFKIAPTCYDTEIKISCEKSFLTSLLYKKKTSTTVYVSEKTESASAEGTTTEKVASSCFKEGTACSYEGTLWAAAVLKYRGHDVSTYIPYLIAMADSNLKYVPYSFLYMLTNNFRTDLLIQQIENKWWSASGDKFYDTAVALLPFSNEDLTEKSNSISWLEEVQGTDGCWQGNLRNTAFLLFSVWPKKEASTEATMQDCEDSGYSCMSSAACLDAEGTVLTDYSGCFVPNVCCSEDQLLPACSDQNGELCDSDESCLGGSTVSASDTTSTKSCCVGGACGVQEETSMCDLQGGICKSTCTSNEEVSSYSCGSSYLCCTPKASSGISIILIILLIILIILVLLGIIFRKKLREWLFRIKSKFGKGKGKPSPSAGGPRFPPTSSSRLYPGAVPRRIIPAQRITAPRAPVRRATPQKKSDFDEVLKKLKEIGK